MSARLLCTISGLAAGQLSLKSRTKRGRLDVTSSMTVAPRVSFSAQPGGIRGLVTVSAWCDNFTVRTLLLAIVTMDHHFTIKMNGSLCSVPF